MIYLVLILNLWLLSFGLLLFYKFIWISDRVVLYYIRFIQLTIEILIISWVPRASLCSGSIKLSGFRLIIFTPTPTQHLLICLINKSDFLILELNYNGFINNYGILLLTLHGCESTRTWLMMKSLVKAMQAWIIALRSHGLVGIIIIVKSI